MQPVRNAVIAAAGLGSRLGLGMPKCMIEVGKQKILSRLVRLLETQVDTIHVVVGYREDLVIDYCAHYHRNVVIARNPDFHTTNTAHSFALGARHLQGKVLFLDGDLLVSDIDLGIFLQRAAQCETLIGLTEPKSEHAVFADTRQAPDGIMVTGFSRVQPASFEWANIVAGPAKLMASVDGYVFEHLSGMLPLPGHAVRLAEVDTAADLEAAENFVREMRVDHAV